MKIGKVKFLFAPLSYGQKAELIGCTKLVSGEEVQDTAKMGYLALKYGIKGMEGLEDCHGEPYSPEFDDEGNLTDEAVSDIFNAAGKKQGDLMKLAAEWAVNVIEDPKIPGVKVDFKNVQSIKKKSICRSLRRF